MTPVASEVQAPTEPTQGGWPAHLHPVTLAVGSALFCLLLSLFPPRLYSTLIGEPDYMFADPLLCLYIGLCAISFCLGCVATAGFSRQSEAAARAGRSAVLRPPPLALASGLAVFAVLIGVVTTIEFIGNPALFFAALATGSAESVRGDAVGEAVDTGFSVLTVLPLGFPLLLWAVYAKLCAAPTRRKGQQRLITVCATLYGLCLVLTLQRNLLIPYLVCLFVLVSGIRLHAHGLSPRRFLRWMLLGSAAIVALFTMIAYFRGGDSESPLAILAGYLPASVNRLSALLQGHLHPAIAGEPYYSFRFLWHPPLIRRFLPIDEWGRSLGLSIPETAIEGWADEFAAVDASPLNPMFIWSTALGYAFYDFGWLSALYFALLGCLTGWAWKRFLHRSTSGILFFPYLATCILLWPTDNFAALPQVWLFVFAALAIKLLSHPWRVSRRIDTRLPAPHSSS